MLTSPYKTATTTPIHETLGLRLTSLARRSPQPWPSCPQAERISDLERSGGPGALKVKRPFKHYPVKNRTFADIQLRHFRKILVDF